MTVELDGWTLRHSPTLPVVPIIGGARGVVLGWPLDGPEVVSSIHVGDNVEDELFRHAGRWAAIILSPEPRVFVDSAASLGVVYDPKQNLIASTTTLLRWGQPYTLSDERFEARHLKPNSFYLSGETSDAAALRLLPNHALDLHSWQVERHGTAPAVSGDPAEHVSTILTATRDALTAAASIAPLTLPVTAGRDSRMVLAAAHGVAGSKDYVTFRYPDHRRVDAMFASRLARAQGLGLTILDLADAGREQKKTSLEHVGYDANEGKARDFFVAASRLGFDRAWITGFAGEVGRCYYWSAVNRHASAEDLLKQMHFAPSAHNVDQLGAWLWDAPDVSPEARLDLLYIEQRLGAWASPQLYGTAPFAVNVMPLASRAAFTAMLSLPHDYRRRQRLAADLVEAGWPDIAGLPFGRVPGIRGRLADVRGLAERIAARIAR